MGILLLGIASMILINGAYAGKDCEKLANCHEPVSYALLLAGGITIAVIRRWKSKRHLRNS